MSISDKAQAAADQVAGKVKQGVGDLTDNAGLQAEGAAQELKGKAEGETERVQDAARDRIDDVKNRLD